MLREVPTEVNIPDSNYMDPNRARFNERVGALIPRTAIRRAALRYLIVAISVLISLSVLAAAAPALLGLDTFVLNGGSMDPSLRTGTLVVARRVDVGSISAGDIVTFRHAETPTTPVTHRVVKVLRGQDGTVQLLTKGDANATADPEPVSGDLPISRMLYSIPYAGYVISLVRAPVGRVLFIAAPIALLLFSLLPLHRNRSSADQAVAPPRLPVPRLRAVIPHPRPTPPVAAPVVPLPPGRLARLRAAVIPHSRPAPPVAAPVAPLPLRRLARLRAASTVHLSQVSRSLDGIEAEAAPLLELVAEQTRLEARFAVNLQRALLPTAEYVEQREENLRRLLVRVRGGGTAPLEGLVDVQEEQRHIEGIHAEMARQESLLRGRFDAEREALDTALAVFDTQVEALESQISVARRTVELISEGMRSAPFLRTLDLLHSRAEQIAALAANGASTFDEAVVGTSAPQSVSAGQTREQRLVVNALPAVYADADGFEPRVAAPAA